MPTDKREREEITLAENLNARPKVFGAPFYKKAREVRSTVIILMLVEIWREGRPLPYKTNFVFYRTELVCICRSIVL